MEKCIPKEFSSKQIKITERISGWCKSDILDFINGQNSAEFAILGGDVMRFNLKSQQYDFTYDSWFLDRNGAQESFADYCERSRKRALEYITNYKSEDGIVFVPVISSELTAGLLK